MADRRKAGVSRSQREDREKEGGGGQGGGVGRYGDVSRPDSRKAVKVSRGLGGDVYRGRELELGENRHAGTHPKAFQASVSGKARARGAAKDRLTIKRAAEALGLCDAALCIARYSGPDLDAYLVGMSKAIVDA